MKTMKVRITFTEDILGTASANPELHSEFIASKAPDAQSRKEEVEALGVDAVNEKTTTVFSRDDDGCPILWDYQIKGFFKNSAGALRKVPGTRSSKVKAYKKEIDNLIFPAPRKIRIQNYGVIGKCERPLRASTAMGERIALAASESIKAGAFIEIEIKYLLDTYEPIIEEWLDYGELNGIGQWHNSGKGRFTWERI